MLIFVLVSASQSLEMQLTQAESLSRQSLISLIKFKEQFVIKFCLRFNLATKSGKIWAEALRPISQTLYDRKVL